MLSEESRKLLNKISVYVRDDYHPGSSAVELHDFIASIFEPSNEQFSPDSEENDISICTPNTVMEILPHLVNLSVTCPLEDIGQLYQDSIETIRKFLPNIQVSTALEPSSFFSGYSKVRPDHDCIENQLSEDRYRIFCDVFRRHSRLTHLTRLLSIHPQYWKVFSQVDDYFLFSDSIPLTAPERHYIAVMAASRHFCHYLVEEHTRDFLFVGGDPTWLTSLKYASNRMQSLDELNQILAHRPWLIDKTHIEILLKPSGGNLTWSMGDLMHAICILAHVHCTCSFLFGCGVNPEIDHELVVDGNQSMVDCQFSSLNEHNQKINDSFPFDTVIERVRRITEHSQTINEETSEYSFREFVRNASNETLPVEYTGSLTHRTGNDLKRYAKDLNYQYTDFANRDAQCIRHMKAQDFSWEDQGFSLANSLFSQSGDLIERRLRVADQLTYHNMGEHQNINTYCFRRAIWNYVHILYGIRHDDYDYKEVNELLETKLKLYAKKVTCFPETVQKDDFLAFMSDLKMSEKVHINLVLMEARLQVEMLYALRAIDRYK